MFNNRVVLDVSGILRQRELLHVECPSHRFCRGYIIRLFRSWLLARLRAGWLVFLVELLRFGGLKLFRELSQRSDKLDLHFPLFAKRIDLPVGRKFAFDFAILETEVVRVNRANRAEALLLMRAVDHLAAKDFTIVIERDDQRAAESAERSVEVGFLILGMILFRKYQVHAGFITEWLTPVCRHIGQLRIFAVTSEHATCGRLHVRGRTRLFGRRYRKRIAGLEQGQLETHIEATGNHRVGLIRLAGFADHVTVLQLEFPGRNSSTAAEHRASRAGTPVFEFARRLKNYL